MAAPKHDSGWCRAQLALRAEVTPTNPEWAANHQAAVAKIERCLTEALAWERVHCHECGARLTDPESIARGLGPCCAERLAA